jgi:hypothetical protein
VSPHAVELARVGRAEQRLIEDGNIGDAADAVLKDETFASRNSPCQPRSVSSESAIEASGNVFAASTALRGSPKMSG